MHQLYAQDLKEVFDVDPERVASRVRNAFLPGWHSPLLLQPDLYGPVLAVAALPQVIAALSRLLLRWCAHSYSTTSRFSCAVTLFFCSDVHPVLSFPYLQCLLISMEIARHGCNPTTQLGNALVVSLFIWLGLSGLYRLLALLVAPSIELKHCLCVTGYGFFAWNVALLCIYPLENFSDSLGIPTMLPLVIFGIPSSLAQVQYTPLVRPAQASARLLQLPLKHA